MRRSRILGLSMAEMMVAMVILFMVGVFVMDMFVGGSRQLVKATKNEKLFSLLRAKASEIRMTEYTDLDSLVLSGNFPAPEDSYQYQISYLDFQGMDQADARIVEITVRHPKLGQRTSRLVRSVVPEDPGKVVFEKFACGTCHALPAAGYPVASGLLGPRLDNMKVISTDRPARPFQTDPTNVSFQDYIIESVYDPNGFDSDLSNANEMAPLINIEGYVSPFDPSTDMSAQEVADLAVWLESFNA